MIGASNGRRSETPPSQPLRAPVRIADATRMARPCQAGRRKAPRERPALGLLALAQVAIGAAAIFAALR